MAPKTADTIPGQRATLIAVLLGLIPAMALGGLSFINQEPPEVREQLLGNLAFALAVASPYLLALAVSRSPNPAARGGLLLSLSILSLAAIVLLPSPVMLLLLPAGIAMVVASVRTISGARRRARWVPLFFVSGLLAAAAIGFSFHALFLMQEGEPRCWLLRDVAGREEWQSQPVPSVSESGAMRMGPLGQDVQRSFCTSDIITKREAAFGLGGVAAGSLVLAAALWVSLMGRREPLRKRA